MKKTSTNLVGEGEFFLRYDVSMELGKLSANKSVRTLMGEGVMSSLSICLNDPKR